MRKSYSYLLLVVSILFLFNACAPTTSLEKEKIISPDRLIIKLEANRRKIKNFNGSGVISVQNKELNAKSNFEVNLKKPDSVKISFFGPFGIDLAHALITSNGFLFYDVINNKIYKGSLKEEALQKILKINLPLSDVIDAFTGSVNLSDKLRREPDNFEYEKNYYRLTYIDSTNSIEKVYTVKADDLSITENSIKKYNGEKLIEGKFSGFKNFNNVPIPMEITVSDFRNQQQIKIEYRNVNINNESQNINIELPEDAKVIEW